MTESTPELRPCPFCGSKGEIEIRNLGDGEIQAIVDCKECNCAIVADSESDAINEWNSAYCWEKLDRLKKSNAALVEAAKSVYYQYFARIQATAHVLQASKSEGDACDMIQKALAEAKDLQ